MNSSQNVGSAIQHSARIQEELRTLILKRKARNEEVFEWIDVSGCNLLLVSELVETFECIEVSF